MDRSAKSAYDKARYQSRRKPGTKSSRWEGHFPGDSKTCSACGAEKPKSLFKRDARRASGYAAICKPCAADASGAYYSKNPESVAKVQKAWVSNNRERTRTYSRRAWLKDKEIPRKRLARAMRCAIGRGVRGTKGGRLRNLDYTMEELRIHLERQFSQGMRWDNYGRWHVDHIIPLSQFGDAPEEFRRAWALANLRPLWARENLTKQARRTHLI